MQRRAQRRARKHCHAVEYDRYHTHELRTDGVEAFIDWATLNAGTKYDGFLTVAAAQIGQVMLTLPHRYGRAPSLSCQYCTRLSGTHSGFTCSLAETGMIPGIILQLVFAGGAIWTLYLLVTLYFEFKKRMVRL